MQREREIRSTPDQTAQTQHFDQAVGVIRELFPVQRRDGALKLWQEISGLYQEVSGTETHQVRQVADHPNEKMAELAAKQQAFKTLKDQMLAIPPSQFNYATRQSIAGTLSLMENLLRDTTRELNKEVGLLSQIDTQTMHQVK